jgi:hypothetical protein
MKGSQRERNKKGRIRESSCCIPKEVCVIDENNTDCIEAVNIETEIHMYLHLQLFPPTYDVTL